MPRVRARREIEKSLECRVICRPCSAPKSKTRTLEPYTRGSDLTAAESAGAEQVLHENALLWHGVGLATTRRRQQEGSAMVPHGKCDQQRRSSWLAATGDRSTCPHRRPGSRSCTCSPAASPLLASSCSSSS